MLGPSPSVSPSEPQATETPMTERLPEHNARIGATHSSRIVAATHCLPSLRVSNAEFMEIFEGPVDWDVDKLAAETRVTSRRWCAPHENTFTMAKDAIERLFADQPELKEEIDVVIVASGTTMPIVHPPEAEYAGMADLATILLRDMGRERSLGLDIKGCYCTGFLRGLQVADGLLANPNFRSALVIATEQGSRFSVAPTNVSRFCFIMSDAAGAVVLRREAPGDERGLIDHVGYTAAQLYDWVGIGHDALSTIMRGSRAAGATAGMLRECADRLLARNNLTIDDVDWLLPIQTHVGIVGGLREALGCPPEKLIWHGDAIGFSGSSSIPAMFSAARQDGRIQDGQLVLSVAVGAGMNCAGALFRA